MTAADQIARDRRLQFIADVRPFRPVAIQLLRLIGDPLVGLDRIVSLLRADPIISAQVLRLANSPLLACRAEVKSILHALSLLGLDRLNVFIMTAAMRGLVDREQNVLTHACWRHCLATALLCERLSINVNLPAERCYIAGLLHDIGRLALLHAFPGYGPAIHHSAMQGRDVLEAERELCGLDHCEAGRLLLGQWGCPLELQSVAAWHESPRKAESVDGKLVFLVAACSELAHAMHLATFPDTPPPEVRDIPVPFAEEARRQLVADFPTLADWVITKVNGIELSLL